jgi:hypothetical protein
MSALHPETISLSALSRGFFENKGNARESLRRVEDQADSLNARIGCTPVPRI